MTERQVEQDIYSCRSWAVWQTWKTRSSAWNFQILFTKCTRDLTSSNFSKTRERYAPRKNVELHLQIDDICCIYIYIVYKCEKLKYIVRIFPCTNVVLRDQRLCAYKWNVGYKDDCKEFHQSWQLLYIMEALQMNAL